MGNKLPKYSLKQILQPMALAALYGPDVLGDEYRDILEHISNDWYILEEDEK